MLTIIINICSVGVVGTHDSVTCKRYKKEKLNYQHFEKSNYIVIFIKLFIYFLFL